MLLRRHRGVAKPKTSKEDVEAIREFAKKQEVEKPQKTEVKEDGKSKKVKK